MAAPELTQNYFELFDLDASFDLDLAQLKQRQQQLQARFHPDRHAGASPRDKRLAVQMASIVNQAYDTLRDPVRRARYLLDLSGAQLPDDSATTSDGAFLIEQIEYREAMESCRHCEHALDRCAQIDDRLRQRQSELARDFIDGYEGGEFDAAIQASRKMQFIQRVQQQLDDLSYQLEEA